MNPLKKLASQTAYYGISSIFGRMLNYALVPLHTRILTQQADYGIMGEMYAYVSFLNIIFLCGMETAFFRFSNQNDPKEVYNNAFSWILGVALLLSGGMICFSPELLQWLSPEKDLTALYKQEYIIYFALILGLDALSAIPFSWLRQQNNPKKFALIKVLNISINVGLNIYFLWFCPILLAQNPNSIFLLGFQPTEMVSYILLANLIASAFTLVFLYQEIILVKIRFSQQLLLKMLKYALPLMIAGLAGMTNETLDRILLKHYLEGSLSERLAQIGIYNAAYKLSIFMTLAIQAFRMAAEPFFFSLHQQENANKTYAKIMTYFVGVCLIIFLGVSMHLDVLVLILGEKYRSGIHIVPILLLANLFLGIYLNLSIWYKLSDKTYWGILLTLFGAIITIVLNLVLIPIYGFLGAAWATLGCYLAMMLAGYFSGQIYFPIPYQWQKIVFWLCGTIIIFLLNNWFLKPLFTSLWLSQALQTVLFIAISGSFIYSLYRLEKSNL